MTISEELAAFGLGLTDLPSATRAAVRRPLLDGFGTAIAAARAGVVRSATQVATELGGPQEATVLAGGARVSAPAAALANGALVHGLDFDDTHADALVHATAVVLPSVLAVAEQVGADGELLLEAAAAGYEVTLRLGAAVPHGFHERGFHATSVVGVFGASLVAARLLGLSHTAAVHALGIAGSLAAGSLEFLGSGASTKQLHPGFAAMNGILAARLAAAGASGPATILEGDRGLFAAYTGVGADPRRILDGLGERYELERITIKPYPVCHLSHAALDAAATLRDRLPDPSLIARVEVELPAESVPIVAEPVDAKRRPTTTYDARFSLPFCLAALLVEGRITTDDLDAAQLARADLQQLASRVEVIPVDHHVAAAAAPGVVRIHLVDGELLAGHVPVSSGGPGRPLDDTQLVAKFLGNVGPWPGDAAALAEAVLGLGAATDLGPLVRTIAAAATLQPSDAFDPASPQGARR